MIHPPTNGPFLGSLLLLFQSEFKCETILLTYANVFDLHENKTACRTHFNIKSFAL